MARKTLSRIASRIHKGAFRKKARAAGKTTGEFAREVERDPGRFSTRTKRQAALARTFAKHRPKATRKNSRSRRS